MADHPMKDIQKPHAHDVLCGRGHGANNHPGNQWFRNQVDKEKNNYHNSKLHEKKLISHRIVKAVQGRKPPGRFLSKNDETGLWYDIGDQKARDKTRQALREGAPEYRKEIIRSTTGGDIDNNAAAAMAASMATATAIRGPTKHWVENVASPPMPRASLPMQWQPPLPRASLPMQWQPPLPRASLPMQWQPPLPQPVEEVRQLKVGAPLRRSDLLDSMTREQLLIVSRRISEAELRQPPPAGLMTAAGSAQAVHPIRRRSAITSGATAAVRRNFMGNTSTDIKVHKAGQTAQKNTTTLNKDGSKKKRTWKKPKDKPCRPLSAYNLFFKSEREVIIKTLDPLPEPIEEPKPEKGRLKPHGKIGFADLARDIAEKWKNLDDETRAPFEAKALKEKERYRVELETREKKKSEDHFDSLFDEAEPCQTPPVDRFLRQNGKAGLLYEIDDEKAREKDSQAPREGAPVIRQELIPLLAGGDIDDKAAAAASAVAAVVGDECGGSGLGMTVPGVAQAVGNIISSSPNGGLLQPPQPQPQPGCLLSFSAGAAGTPSAAAMARGPTGVRAENEVAAPPPRAASPPMQRQRPRPQPPLPHQQRQQWQQQRSPTVVDLSHEEEEEGSRETTVGVPLGLGFFSRMEQVGHSDENQNGDNLHTPPTAPGVGMGHSSRLVDRLKGHRALAAVAEATTEKERESSVKFLTLVVRLGNKPETPYLHKVSKMDLVAHASRTLASYIRETLAQQKPSFKYHDEDIKVVETAAGAEISVFLKEPLSEWGAFVSSSDHKNTIEVVIDATPRPIQNTSIDRTRVEQQPSPTEAMMQPKVSKGYVDSFLSRLVDDPNRSQVLSGEGPLLRNLSLRKESAGLQPTLNGLPSRPDQTGDPRMAKAVKAKLENSDLSLLEALQKGGFVFLNMDQPHTEVMDMDNVSLFQRKNQLLRRIRLVKDKEGKERKFQVIRKTPPHLLDHSRCSNDANKSTSNAHGGSTAIRSARLFPASTLEKEAAEEVLCTIDGMTDAEAAAEAPMAGCTAAAMDASISTRSNEVEDAAATASWPHPSTAQKRLSSLSATNCARKKQKVERNNIMSRRRQEFRHRTPILEGAYRAWSYLGNINPQDLEMKSVAELDSLLGMILKNDPQNSIQRRKECEENEETEAHVQNLEDIGAVGGKSGELKNTDVGTGERRRNYSFEPLPRSGLDHKFVQSVLYAWLGPACYDQDTLEQGLKALRNWWQHRREGESGEAVDAFCVTKVREALEEHTHYFFNLAHHLVTTSKQQPPRTLRTKLLELDKSRKIQSKQLLHKRKSASVQEAKTLHNDSHFTLRQSPCEVATLRQSSHACEPSVQCSKANSKDTSHKAAACIDMVQAEYSQQIETLKIRQETASLSPLNRRTSSREETATRGGQSDGTQNKQEHDVPGQNNIQHEDQSQLSVANDDVNCKTDSELDTEAVFDDDGAFDDGDDDDSMTCEPLSGISV